MSLKYFTNNQDVAKIVLSANPDLYDYYHLIELTNTGKVVILDAGSQCSYGCIVGEFEVKVIDTKKASINFFNLSLLDPYNNSIKFSNIGSIEVQVETKNMEFKFNPDYEEVECLYTRCYEFKIDPLNLFRNNCSKYSDKYIPKLEEDSLSFYKNNPENFANNGIYFNKLETRYYLNLDEQRISLLK